MKFKLKATKNNQIYERIVFLVNGGDLIRAKEEFAMSFQVEMKDIKVEKVEKN